MTETAAQKPTPIASRLVRGLSSGWVGWTIALVFLGLLVALVLRNNRVELASQYSFGTIAGPAAATLSRVLINRGLPAGPVNWAFYGFCLGLAGVVAFVLNDRATVFEERLLAAGVALTFFPLAGYLAGGGAKLIFGPKPARPAAEPVEPPPAVVEEPDPPAAPEPAPAPPPPPGTVIHPDEDALAKVFRLLANERNRWILAGVAAFASMTYFFQIGDGWTALGFVLLSFVALPAGIMAGAMADRRMPKLPVMSALVGAAFGLAYAGSAGLAAAQESTMGVLALIAFVIIGPLFGFTLAGGIANVFVSRGAPPPKT